MVALAEGRDGMTGEDGNDNVSEDSDSRSTNGFSKVKCTFFKIFSVFIF